MRLRSRSLICLAALLGAACSPVVAVKPDKSQPAISLSWTRAHSPALKGEAAGVAIAGVLAPSASSGWVVVGTTTDQAGNSTGTIWRSANGKDWVAQSVPPGPSGWQQHVNGAAWAGRDLIMVGELRQGPARQGMVWIAGESGAALPQARFESGSDRVTRVGDVAAGKLGVVASGRVGSPARDRAALWYSRDGRQWRRLRQAESIISRQSDPQVTGVSMGRSAAVAVGVVRGNNGLEASAWYSADGTSWAQAEGEGFSGKQDVAIEGVTADGGGFLAAGYQEAGQQHLPALWRSSNGRTWTAVKAQFGEVSRGTDDFGTQLHAVTSFGTLRIVSGGGPVGERIWVSGDMSKWLEVVPPDNFLKSTSYHFDLLAGTKDAFLVADSNPLAPRLLYWEKDWTEVTAASPAFMAPRASLSAPAVFADDHEAILTSAWSKEGRAVGSQDLESRIWTSPDGTTWTPGQQTGQADVFKGAYVSQVLRGPDGLVAVGGITFDEALRRGGNPPAAAWSSKDGITWTPSPEGSPVFGGEASYGMAGVARRGDRIVAVGGKFLSDADGVIWILDAGRPWRRVEPLPMGGPGQQRMSGICAGPKGFVAVGSEQLTNQRYAAAWFSPDGESWVADHTASLKEGSPAAMRSCRGTEDGFIAAGSISAGRNGADAAIWTSTDGKEWTRAASPSLGGPGLQGIEDVAVDGRTALAVGEDGTISQTSIAMWISRDTGRTWRRVSLPDDLFRGQDSSSVSTVTIAGGKAWVSGTVDYALEVWSAPL